MSQQINRGRIWLEFLARVALVAVSVALVAFMLAWLITGCTPAKAPEEEPPECRDTTLGALVAECLAKINKACAGKDYDTCPEREPMQRDCEKQIDAWEKCGD